MAEALGKGEWKSFVKDEKLDLEGADSGLLKALEDFEKTDRGVPGPRLDALQKLDEQIAKVVVALGRLKKEKDKDKKPKLDDKLWKKAKDKLDALLAESERQTKESRAAKTAAAGASSAPSAEAVKAAGATTADLDALSKKLAAAEKMDPSQLDQRLKALDVVDAEAAKQMVALGRNKKLLGDKLWKEFKEKLDGILAECESLTHATRDAQSEEPDSPALLTKKMIPLLRELRKPEVRMHALVATAGKNTAVLIMRRAIATSRRKLLAEFVDAKGGVKYIVGECLYEKGALTFVVQSQASGLAKRVRAALLAQTELRVKVRVRGEDGEQDEDGEDEDDAAEASGAAAGAAAAPRADGRAAPASTDEQAQAGEEPQADEQLSAEARAWAQRVQRLQDRYDAALRAGHSESTKLRALMGFASEKADDQHDYAAASKALDMVEKLLGAAAGAATSAGAAQPAAGAAGAAQAPAGAKRVIAPAIVYTQSRLAWVATRSKIQKDMKKLEDAILDAYRGDAVLPEVTKSLPKLQGVLEKFDDSLVDKLDSAMNTADETEKQRWHAEAREVISRYQGFLETDPLVRELDGNPFVPIEVQATLTKTLATLASKIV